MDTSNNQIEEVKGSSSFKMIMTLAIAGLFSGFFLATTFIYTDPVIQNNKKEEMFAAVFEVLPGCEVIESMDFINNSFVHVTDQSSPVNPIFIGKNKEGDIVGFAFPASEPGFQDLITALIGYNPTTDRIIGLKILDSKETPGLGDKIFKDEAFKSNFLDLDVSGSIEFAKKGEKTTNNQVEGITGATISSKAVTNLLINSIGKWKEPIKNYGNGGK